MSGNGPRHLRFYRPAGARFNLLYRIAPGQPVDIVWIASHESNQPIHYNYRL